MDLQNQGGLLELFAQTLVFLLEPFEFRRWRREGLRAWLFGGEAGLTFPPADAAPGIQLRGVEAFAAQECAELAVQRAGIRVGQNPQLVCLGKETAAGLSRGFRIGKGSWNRTGVHGISKGPQNDNSGGKVSHSTVTRRENKAKTRF